MKENAKGHLLALFTICVWGTTFIATKVLLKAFTPIEILFMRFLIGYFLLLLMNRQGLSVSNKKQELYFIGAGLTGVTFYFLLENIALTYTYASNVGIIIATAPFFTAILGRMFLKEEKLKTGFFVGFLTSITGIILISIHGSSAFSLNPNGDILAFSGCFCVGMLFCIGEKNRFFRNFYHSEYPPYFLLWHFVYDYSCISYGI